MMFRMHLLCNRTWLSNTTQDNLSQVSKKTRQECFLAVFLMQKLCNSNFDKSLVFLAGQTGVGNTHLIKCMANELIGRHKLVLLTSSFAMHQDFIKSYACRDAEEKQNIISKYI